MTDAHPLTCIGCGTTAFDASAEAGERTDAVMSIQRFWAKPSTVEGEPGPDLTWAVCNRCYDRGIGVLWAQDGTPSRVWFGDDADPAELTPS